MTTLTFPLKITLTTAERKLAHLIGTLRQMENRAVGIVDLRVQEKAPSEDIDKLGIAAELAFARAANVYPDLCTDSQDTEAWKNRLGGLDCTLPSGITVDVKSTSRADGNLIAPTSKDKNTNCSDITVLVTGQLPLTETGKDDLGLPAEFTIVGWVWSSELYKPSRIRPLRGGKPTYFLDRDYLYTELPLLERPLQNQVGAQMEEEAVLDLDAALEPQEPKSSYEWFDQLRKFWEK